VKIKQLFNKKLSTLDTSQKICISGIIVCVILIFWWFALFMSSGKRISILEPQPEASEQPSIIQEGELVNDPTADRVLILPDFNEMIKKEFCACECK
jgi:hypothetical protein